MKDSYPNNWNKNPMKQNMWEEQIDLMIIDEEITQKMERKQAKIK